jgi:hypothetical protein
MLWLGAQVFAIHSVESWRYERGCAHLRNLVESTRSVLIALRADSSSGPTVAVLAPEIWNVSDYRAVVRVFAGELATPTSVEWFASSAESRALVAPGARLDPASVPVFTSFDEGHVQRLDARGADAFLSRLAESPRVYAGKSSGRVPVIWLDLVMPRIGG